MANWDNHQKQAEHNESFAAQLEADPGLRYWDWLITIAFYSAVHYVEAAFFFIREIGHTETACKDGQLHAFRARNVRKHFGDECWKSYRKLMNASYNVRYLGDAKSKPLAIAVQYYSLNDAKNVYNIDLAKVREATQ